MAILNKGKYFVCKFCNKSVSMRTKILDDKACEVSLRQDFIKFHTPSNQQSQSATKITKHDPNSIKTSHTMKHKFITTTDFRQPTSILFVKSTNIQSNKIQSSEKKFFNNNLYIKHNDYYNQLMSITME